MPTKEEWMEAFYLTAGQKLLELVKVTGGSEELLTILQSEPHKKHFRRCVESYHSHRKDMPMNLTADFVEQYFQILNIGYQIGGLDEKGWLEPSPLVIEKIFKSVTETAETPPSNILFSTGD